MARAQSRRLRRIGRRASRPSYLEQLPSELWHEVLSNCSAEAVLNAAKACRAFRDIVADRNLHAVSRENVDLFYALPAPEAFLFESDPPAFRVLCLGRKNLLPYTPEVAAGFNLFATYKDCGAAPNIFDRKASVYSGASYDLFIHGGGKCYVCGKETSNYPHDLMTQLRLCSTTCLGCLHQHKGYLCPMPMPDEKGTMPSDAYLVPWLPYIRRRRKRYVLVEDLNRARQELREAGVANEEGDLSPSLDLAEAYKRRSLMRGSLEFFHHYYQAWHNHHCGYVSPMTMRNRRKTSRYGRRHGLNLISFAKNPVVRRTVAAYNRNVEYVTPAALRDAVRRSGLKVPLGKVQCDVCERIVMESGLEQHMLCIHPETVPLTRVDPASGLEVHRCESCPKSLAWLSPQQLADHRRVRHASVSVVGS
ncbi:hypothetical protein BD626DRAFT_568216 [Schizophyllum amplum]|uniref:F-box domain-containing protein n=1 Tax=Schizophyllum amplum TaxID=97359 RepID=A0A550CI79_9AGAR|nr:hypothetical protein BD626DRAFT_568216 [Auriculariopsis ampla]